MKLKLLRDPKLGYVYYQLEYSTPSWRLWICMQGKGNFSYHSLGAWEDDLGWGRKWHKLI